jgi:hypothetical protein
MGVLLHLIQVMTILVLWVHLLFAWLIGILELEKLTKIDGRISGCFVLPEDETLFKTYKRVVSVSWPYEYWPVFCHVVVVFGLLRKNPFMVWVSLKRKLGIFVISIIQSCGNSSFINSKLVDRGVARASIRAHHLVKDLFGSSVVVMSKIQQTSNEFILFADLV